MQLQNRLRYQQPLQPVAPAPVTGYPNYGNQYNSEYSSYNSVPVGGYPAGPSVAAPGYKPGNIEMGYPQ